MYLPYSSLTHIYDFAQSSNNKNLLTVIQNKAKEFYGNDKSCPTSYEPGPYDFISPCLIEADLMRRILSKKEFKNWEQSFLGNLKKNSSIFVPVIPLKRWTVTFSGKLDTSVLGQNYVWLGGAVTTATAASAKPATRFGTIGGAYGGPLQP